MMGFIDQRLNVQASVAYFSVMSRLVCATSSGVSSESIRFIWGKDSVQPFFKALAVVSKLGEWGRFSERDMV